MSDLPKKIAETDLLSHSIGAESSVLGGLLRDNTGWDRVAVLLTDSDFYRYEHRLIYRAIGNLINRAETADVITVADHCSDDHPVNAGRQRRTPTVHRNHPAARHARCTGRITLIW